MFDITQNYYPGSLIIHQLNGNIATIVSIYEHQISDVKFVKAVLLYPAETRLDNRTIVNVMCTKKIFFECWGRLITT